jgi:hypothetical protein
MGANKPARWLSALLGGAVVAALLCSCGAEGPDQAVLPEQRDLDSAPVRDARRVVMPVHNPTQGVSVGFTAEGVELTGQDQRFHLGVRTTQVWCDERPLPLRNAEPELDIQEHAVEYARVAGSVGLAAWYLNGPAGLGHGLRLEQSPCESGAMIGIAIQFDGLRPVRSGDRLRLEDERGNAPAQCTDWYAEDALGQNLPIVLRVADGAVRLEVDVARATWPVELELMLSLERHLALTGSD